MRCLGLRPEERKPSTFTAATVTGMLDKMPVAAPRGAREDGGGAWGRARWVREEMGEVIWDERLQRLRKSWTERLVRAQGCEGR